LQILAPLPRDGIPIYCVGLNYRTHAKEAKVPVTRPRIDLIADLFEQLEVPSYPPLWTKPALSIAHPDEEIRLNDFCAKSLPDYEVKRLIGIIESEIAD
jgi:2-keto-4-pentenoate hydratase/2-oxohepta-3-ene-1,7-dioic acid hydratase in catechol pathway